MEKNILLQNLSNLEDRVFALENISSALSFWESLIMEDVEEITSSAKRNVPLQVSFATLRGYHSISGILVDALGKEVEELKAVCDGLYQAARKWGEEDHNAEDQSRR